MNGIREWIDGHFDEQLALLKTLAAIPAPSGMEDKRVKFLLDWCADNGVTAFSDEAKNVVIPMGEGEEISVYSAHTDVVFPDETPLPVREENGVLYAPGVGDDTANVVAVLMLIRYIKENGLTPKKPFLFVLNTCEEGLGNLKGVRRIMKDYAGRVKKLVSFDCSFEEGMVVRAVGSERWRVTARTEGGHSYMAFGKPNAIHRMAQLVERLYEQTVPVKQNCRTTYNVGGITGGTSINTIAQSCEMLYEYRSDDRDSLKIMREQFEKLVAEADTDEAQITTELLGERPCGGNVDEAELNRLFDGCEEIITRVLGRNVPRFTASTDANIPLSLGVPAVTFGLFSGDGAHTREEWLNIDSLKPGLEIGIRLVLKEQF